MGFLLLIARSTSRATKGELVAGLGESEDEAARPLDSANDLVAVTVPGPYVARSDPAFEPALLQRADDLLNLLVVSLGVANKGREVRRLVGPLFRKRGLLFHPDRPDVPIHPSP